MLFKEGFNFAYHIHMQLFVLFPFLQSFCTRYAIFKFVKVNFSIFTIQDLKSWLYIWFDAKSLIVIIISDISSYQHNGDMPLGVTS